MTERIDTITERLTEKAVDEAREKALRACQAFYVSMVELGVSCMSIPLDERDGAGRSIDMDSLVHRIRTKLRNGDEQMYRKVVEAAHQAFLHKVDGLAQDYEDLKSIVERRPE
jgi:hypothetical protein